MPIVPVTSSAIRIRPDRSGCVESLIGETAAVSEIKVCLAIGICGWGSADKNSASRWLSYFSAAEFEFRLCGRQLFFYQAVKYGLPVNRPASP
jgi:hypothetical protein